MKAATKPSARRARPHRAAPQTCRHAAGIWPYLDGELGPRRAAAMAIHVASCGACAATARRLCEMLEACRSVGCRALPVDVRRRARERARALLATRRTS